MSSPQIWSELYLKMYAITAICICIPIHIPVPILIQAKFRVHGPVEHLRIQTCIASDA